jgi:hypothetical protein
LEERDIEQEGIGFRVTDERSLFLYTQDRICINTCTCISTDFFLPKYQCVLNVTISLIKLFILVIHFLTAQYSPTETQQSRTLKCPFLGNVNEIIPLDEHKH